MINFKIGDNVFFKKIKGGKWYGHEKEPYTIINTLKEQKQTMYYVKNKVNEFWTSATALILDNDFIATEDWDNQVSIKYSDGREEKISSFEYAERYLVRFETKPKKKVLYEQLSLF